jgi:hypothetical protein
MSLPIEYTYEVRTGLVAGAFYLLLGMYMLIRPVKWVTSSFFLLPVTRMHVQHIGISIKAQRVIRALGLFFVLISCLMIQHCTEMYFYLKNFVEQI